MPPRKELIIFGFVFFFNRHKQRFLCFGGYKANSQFLWPLSVPVFLRKSIENGYSKQSELTYYLSLSHTLSLFLSLPLSLSLSFSLSRTLSLSFLYTHVSISVSLSLFLSIYQISLSIKTNIYLIFFVCVHLSR